MRVAMGKSALVKQHLYQERSSSMISRHNGVQVIDGTPDRTPQLTDWLTSWPSVRCEVEALLKQYERHNEQYDPYWTEWVIDMMDGTISNLAHRAAWLKARLEQPE